jgi:hypothetical protein
MGRPRLIPRDSVFWDHVRHILEDLHKAGHSWTDIAGRLHVGKQTLTGFRKHRAEALDAEAVLRLCSEWNQRLTLSGHIIGRADELSSGADVGLTMTMEFDDSFEIRTEPNPSVILVRKPPNRVSYIGVRIAKAGRQS